MMISALCAYYDFLVKRGEALPKGYSKVSITHVVTLNKEGCPVGVIPRFVDENGKKVYNDFSLFPKRTEKPGIDANIVEHRPVYLFGLEVKDGKFEVTAKATKSHADFVRKNTVFFEGIDSPLARAFMAFIRMWDPASQTENEVLLPFIREYSTARIAFAMRSDPSERVQEDPQVKAKWDKECENSAQGEDSVMSQCPILGQVLPVARVHNKIKGVIGGRSSGCSLVCFNNEAENSFGKEQSFNSAVSVEAMERYTEALNYLLQDKAHHRYVNGMTIVHFAMSDDDSALVEDVNSLMATAAEEKEDPVEAGDKQVVAVWKKIVYGKRPEFKVTDKDDVRYYMFGIVPNSSRLAIRFTYCNTFGCIRENVDRYHNDFAIGEMLGAPPLTVVARTLAGKPKKQPKEGKYDLSADIVQGLLMSILQNRPIPYKILALAVRRIRTDLYVDDVRAGLLKAALLRKNEKYKEKITMALNKENHDAAYLCGRLFAVLEKIQKDQGNKLNKTIKDSFFTAASATPAVTFARLIPLSQKHLAKVEREGNAHYLNMLATDIIDNIQAFPKTLSLEEQAEFILGYYQQNKDLYTSKTDKTNTEEEN